MDALAAGKSPVHSLSALSKLFLTILYIAVTVSFNKYDITGIFIMVLFPIAGYVVSGIPVSTCFKKLRVVMPLVCVVGIINPFLDREIIMYVGHMGISGGVVSMLTLMMKGVFSLMMSFLLMATTKIEYICAGLRKIHFPRILTSLILLTYRYISVLLREVSIMTVAYSLRAPGQRGIHISAWGSFLGQLILRSMDRANDIYDSMSLRGFDGNFYFADGRKGSKWSWPAVLAVAVLCILVRFINVAALTGALIIK